MYLYYDKNGILKEIVNDAPIIQYDSNSKAYVYIEQVDVSGNIVVDSDGYYVNAASYLTYYLNWYEYDAVHGRKVAKQSIAAYTSGPSDATEIPFDRKRDLKFFQYGKKYHFIEVNLGSETYTTTDPSPVSFYVLSHVGEIMLSMSYTINNSTKYIGKYVFTVQDNGILPTEKIDASQFEYLLSKVLTQKGDRGYHFTPSVDVSGNISWTNDGGLENPQTQNIKGPIGATGATGADGAPALVYKVLFAWAGGSIDVPNISISDFNRTFVANEQMMAIGRNISNNYTYIINGHISSITDQTCTVHVDFSRRLTDVSDTLFYTDSSTTKPTVGTVKTCTNSNFNVAPFDGKTSLSIVTDTTENKTYFYTMRIDSVGETTSTAVVVYVSNSLTGRGITSITGPAREGLVDTYTINYSDSTTSTFNVTNGKMGLWYPSVISQSAESSAPAVGDTFQALVTAFSRIPIQGEVVQTMWISHINVMYLCLATITNIDTTTNMATITLTHVNRVNGTQGQVGTTPEISMYATATSTTSATPIVTVSKSGTLTEPRYDFAFSGLKGVKGDTGEKGDTGNPGSVLFYKNALNISTPTGGNVLTLDTGIFNVTPQPTQTAFAIVQNQTGTYFISLLINTVNSQNTTATVTSVSSSFKGAQGATGESYLTLTQIVELNAAPTSGTTFTRIGSYFNRSASVGENILFFVVKDTTTNYLYACSGTIISDSAGYTVQISSATKISGTNGVDGKDALMVKSIPTTSTVATSFTIQVYETRFNRTPVQGEYISNLLLQYTVDNSIYLCTGTLISVDTSGYTPLWTIRVGVANKLTGTNGTNGVDACMCNATGYLSTIAVNDYIYSDSSQTTLVFASSTFTKLNSSDCFIICSVAGTSYLVFAEKTFFAPGYKLQVKQFAQLGNSGTVSNWGDIGGTLSNQTDLQSALDAKVSTSSSASVVYATTNAGAQTTMSLIGGDGQESPSALTGVPVYTNGSLITSSPSYGYSCVNKNYMHTYVPQPTASTPTNAVLTKTSSGIAWQTVSGSGLDTFTYSGNNQAKIGYILKNCKGVVGAEIVITIGGSLEDGVGFHMSLPQVIGENYNNIDWEGSTSTVNGTFYAARFRYRSSDSAFVLAACTKMDCTTGQSIISQVNNGAFYSATITYLSSSVL